MNYFNNSSNDTSNNNNSSNQRTVFFIDTSNPEVNQTISACGSNPFIKPPFPPVIDIRELIIKLTNGKLPAKSPNAFIIYRKAFLDTACANGYKLPMTVISTMVSKSWESEPQYVKDEYKKLSKEAFNRLNEMNPKSIKPNKRETLEFCLL
ncbi:2088_t:CDS:1 [Entrophospora sp. SA101]|nr:2088_t:CDS:1 [Entrophospora sp. SA101]